MADTSLRKLREDSGLRLEVVAARMQPPMSWRTLHRWEQGEIPKRNFGHRDSWLEQLSDLYDVSVERLTNGTSA